MPKNNNNNYTCFCCFTNINLIKCVCDFVCCKNCFIEAIKNTYTNKKFNCACNKHKLHIDSLEYINMDETEKTKFIKEIKHIEKLRYMFKNSANIEYFKYILLDKQTKLSNLLNDFKNIYNTWFLPKIILNNYYNKLKKCLKINNFKVINDLIIKYEFNKDNLESFINIVNNNNTDKILDNLIDYILEYNFDEFYNKYNCKVFEQRETIINCPYFIEENEHKIFCKGKVDTKTWKCLECNKSVCPKCYSIYESNHKCNIETFDITKCPKCHVLIHRSEGCDDMICTHCNTRFNIKTKEITETNTNHTYKAHHDYSERNVIDYRMTYKPRNDYMGIDLKCGKLLKYERCMRLIKYYANSNEYLKSIASLFNTLDEYLIPLPNKNSVKKIIISIIKNVIFSNNEDLLNNELIDIYNEYKSNVKFNKSLDTFRKCLSSILIENIIDINQIIKITNQFHSNIINIKQMISNKIITTIDIDKIIDLDKSIDLYKDNFKYSLLSIPLNKSVYKNNKEIFQYDNYNKEKYIDDDIFNDDLNKITLAINEVLEKEKENVEENEEEIKLKFKNNIIDYTDYKNNIKFINNNTTRIKNIITNLLSLSYSVNDDDIINIEEIINSFITSLGKEIGMYITELFNSNVPGYKLNNFNIIKA